MYIHVIVFVLSVRLSSHVLGECSAAGVNKSRCLRRENRKSLFRHSYKSPFFLSCCGIGLFLAPRSKKRTLACARFLMLILVGFGASWKKAFDLRWTKARENLAWRVFKIVIWVSASFQTIVENLILNKCRGFRGLVGRVVCESFMERLWYSNYRSDKGTVS